MHTELMMSAHFALQAWVEDIHVLHLYSLPNMAPNKILPSSCNISVSYPPFLLHIRWPRCVFRVLPADTAERPPTPIATLHHNSRNQIHTL